MQIEDNRHPAVDEVLNQMAASYQLTEQREGIHCTDCIYCLRKAYWNKTDALPSAPIEAIHFLTGLGLQDVLLGKTQVPSKNVNGIWFSADYFEDGVLLELKTTMIGEKRLKEHEFPEGWLLQMMSYCSAYQTDSCILLVLPLLTKRPLSFFFTFSEQELEENWNWLGGRASELGQALANETVPASKGFDWECRDCRYRLRCQLLDAEGGT